MRDDSDSLCPQPLSTDVSDDEWALVAPCLTLLPEDALQRRYPQREVFNALRWMVRGGAPWRLLPTNFPPWPVVYQQTHRRLDAGCFEAQVVHDLRLLLRLARGRHANLRRRSGMSACCRRVPRAGRAPATTGTNGARAPRCMRRSIRWANCWP